MNTIQKSMRDVAFELLSKKKNPDFRQDSVLRYYR